MKNYIGLILLLIFQSCAVNQSPISDIVVSEASQLSSFQKGGTTAMLRSVYRNYEEGNKRKLTPNEIEIIKTALRQGTAKKHRQKKITSIYAVLEVCTSKKRYCLLLTEEIIFDIINNTEYNISELQNLQLQNVFKR